MICKQCGKEFVQQHFNEKYCSDECRRVYLKGYYQEYFKQHRVNHIVNSTCIVCGKAISGRSNKKYCSKQCANLGFWQRKLEHMAQQQQ